MTDPFSPSEQSATEPPNPCADVVVTAADGALLAVRPHGGHVTPWRPAGTTTGCGCPARHDADPARRSGAATRALWPHAFELRLDATAAGDSLAMSLVARDTGAEPWAFTGALHAYLATGSVAATRADGVGGATAEDNAAGRARLVLDEGPLALDRPVDLAIRNVSRDVAATLPDGSRVALIRDGLPDVVVWNPGPQAPADVHPGGWSEFVCVEPASLDPVTVAPGEDWAATAQWRWSPPG